MLGYNDLRDPSVSGFFRFLARVGILEHKIAVVTGVVQSVDGLASV